MGITHKKTATFADQPGVEINKGEWNDTHNITLTKAEFNTACSDGDFVFVGDATMAIGGTVTSVTQGSVLFAGASGVLAQDNAHFFYDDTKDCLVLNGTTATTDCALDINGTNKALRLPQLTNSQMNALTKSKGMMIYNSDFDNVYFVGQFTQWLGLYVPWFSGDFFTPSNLTWKEAQTNGSDTITMTAPAALSGSITLTLPTTTGTFIVSAGKQTYDSTVTAAGTTGNQTINKPSGTVNFAAAATSLTVTNSLCTTSSIVHAVIRTNDATATLKNVVPGSGSFVINLNAAATAETSVGFFIIN